VRFEPGGSNLDTYFSTLRLSRARIIAVIAQASDAARFIGQAYRDGGIGGAGYLWFTADGATNYDMLDSAELAPDSTTRAAIAKGIVGTGLGAPSNARHAAFRQALAARSPTTPQLSGSSGVCPNEAASAACNLETDDDGNYIWCGPRISPPRRTHVFLARSLPLSLSPSLPRWLCAHCWAARLVCALWQGARSRLQRLHAPRMRWV
jgi:hypothetical protein